MRTLISLKLLLIKKISSIQWHKNYSFNGFYILSILKYKQKTLLLLKKTNTLMFARDIFIKNQDFSEDGNVLLL